MQPGSVQTANEIETVETPSGEEKSSHQSDRLIQINITDCEKCFRCCNTSYESSKGLQQMFIGKFKSNNEAISIGQLCTDPVVLVLPI